jgi:tetratricopeptide (TPR) repeat protein
MQARHLDLVTLERFAISDLAAEEMVEAGRHLSACANCRSRLRGEVVGGMEVLERLSRKGWPTEEPTEYEQVFERLQQSALERIQCVQDERVVAPRLAEELALLPFAEQRSKIGEHARFHNAALANLLLEDCSALALKDPLRAEGIAGIALDIADKIQSHYRGIVLANDLRARAWAAVGNTLRIRSDFWAAESAFVTAESFLEEGSGDPLERARVLDLKASLLRAQRRFDQALSAIDQVISIYRRIREDHRQGRALISKAMIYGYAGEQEKGISLIFQALDLIDTEKEPRLALISLNNLLVDLTEIGRYEDAMALLPEIRRQVAANGTRADRFNVIWAEAQLETSLGQLELAEAKLRLVRDEFIAQGIGYDAAVVLLDLAKIYLRQGRTAETRQIAAEMHRIFVSREIHREAVVALVFFQQAVEQERATVQLVEEITGYLKRSQGNPDLPFERPA